MATQKETGLTLTTKERESILAFFKESDSTLLKNTFEAISQMVRAFEGRNISAEDIITRLTNVKNILERSRFPTYPLLAKQVYLRLIHKYNPQAIACKDWANLEAEALISYKGKSREEYTEQMKASANVGEQQSFSINPSLQAEPKRRFWQRKAKEQTEFVNE